MVQVVKDKKGACYIVSHKRCGVTECLFLTRDELLDIAEFVNKNIVKTP